MGEHCLGEYCTLLKFAYFSCFYFVVYLSLTSCLRSLLLLCILVRGIRSPTRSSFVKSSISSFITWWPFCFKIPFHFHFSMIQFHFHFYKSNFCCDHLHILVVPVWLEGLPFLILCTHSILQTFLCSCFKMFCIWGQKNCEIILSLRESVRSSEAFSIYFMILNVHFWHYDFFLFWAFCDFLFSLFLKLQIPVSGPSLNKNPFGWFDLVKYKCD